MTGLLVTPVVIPLAVAALAVLLRDRPGAARVVNVAGALGLLAAGVAILARVVTDGTQVAHLGGWPAPYGVSFVADRLSAALVVITGLTGLAVAVYDIADMEPPRGRLGHVALFQVLLAGIAGAFLTGDLFNLYVWFEVMLIASFGLLTLGGGRARIDGAVKYVAVNLVATLTFLTAIGLLYGLTGTLNLAELSVRVRALADPGPLAAVATLLLVAFGIKAAVFPLYSWLPASYHTPPAAVSAVFSGLLTKVGVYALIRVFTLVFPHDVGATQTVLLVVAGLTMLAGVLGAASQTEIRRILSFHIVSQIGYMVLGLALFTPLGLAGAVFYLIHHIVVKANLFLVGGVAERVGGSAALDRLGGLYRARPWLAVLFLIPAFSLAGFPPLSGFWAKLLVIRASLADEAWLLAGVALVVGLFTLFSMLKIWVQAFWKPAPPDAGVETTAAGVETTAAGAETTAVGAETTAVGAETTAVGAETTGAAPHRSAGPSRRELLWRAAPIAALAAVTVVIGLWTEPFLAFATEAADELLDPTGYVRVVLGGAP